MSDAAYRRWWYEQNKEKAKADAKRRYEVYKTDPEFMRKRAEYNKAWRQRPDVKVKNAAKSGAYIKSIRHTPEFKAKKRKWSIDAYYRIREANRPLMEEFFGAGCTKCGEPSRACLEAHHLDPTEKERNVSFMWRLANQDAIRAELSKCICVCANCHRKIHAGEL